MPQIVKIAAFYFWLAFGINVIVDTALERDWSAFWFSMMLCAFFIMMANLFVGLQKGETK